MFLCYCLCAGDGEEEGVGQSQIIYFTSIAMMRFLLLFIVVLNALLFGGQVSAQHHVLFYDPDFDSAFCVSEIMFDNLTDEERPLSYAHFFSQYEHDHSTAKREKSYPFDDSGFVTSYSEFSDALGCMSMTYHSTCDYSIDRLGVTVKYQNETAKGTIHGLKVYSFNEKKLPRSVSVWPDLKLDSNFSVSYKYDSQDRITYIFRKDNHGEKLLHRYVYTNDSASLSKWDSTQSRWYKATRKMKFKLNEQIDEICDPQQLKREINLDGATIWQQYDSVTGGTCYVFVSSQFTYSYISYDNPNKYIFISYDHVQLFKWKNRRPESYFSCFTSMGCPMDNHTQIIGKKRGSNWHISESFGGNKFFKTYTVAAP
jgi:hypothetical protein